jgi:hypothetical protein
LPGTDQPFDATTFDAAAYGRFAARDYDELYAELDPSAAAETLARRWSSVSELAGWHCLWPDAAW